MAVTLESVMRMNDQFSATLSKYSAGVEAAKKKTDEAKVSGTGLSSTFKNIGTSSGTAATGISGLVGKLATLVSGVYLAKKAFDFLKESIQTAATQQVQQTTFQSLMGSKQLGNDLYSWVSAYAQKSALDRENVASATTSFLAYTKDINQLQNLMNLTQRLYMFNPEQGASGAVFAIKEVLGGQTQSIKDRYNMTGLDASKITEMVKKNDISGIVSYLDKTFTKFGATQGVVDANFKSLTVQAQLFKTNLMSAIGDQSNSAVQSLSQTFQRLNADMQAGKFQPFFNVMAKGTAALASGLSWVAQNAYWLIPAIGGVVTALVVFNTAMSLSRNIALLTGATVQAVAGNWVGAAVAIAGAAATIGLATSMSKQNDDLKKSAATLSDTKAAADKFAAEQKKLGASTLGNSATAGAGAAASVPTKVTNSSPIKVSGTVEIAKENLKYMFEAATSKFYAQFNATKVEPVVNIANQNVTQTADINEINHALGSMVAETAGVSAGGNYK